jgi:hypothetical protein
VRLKVSKMVETRPPDLGRAAVSGRRNKPPAAARVASAFVGVSWQVGAKPAGRWKASIWHSRSDHYLGLFVDEQEAARAFDAAARRLRPKGKAHGGRSGVRWQRLNFPTAKEQAYAARQGLPSAEGKSAAVAKAAVQGFVSAFVGVGWYKRTGRWSATIWHDGTLHHVGCFNTDQEAAAAYDAAARRLRPKGKAHGVLAGKHWLRVNFPTPAEQAFAKGEGMPPRKKRK